MFGKESWKNPQIFRRFWLKPEQCYDESRKVTISFLINDGNRVELMEQNLDSKAYPLLKKCTYSIYHLNYLMDDLDDALSDLRVD